MQKTTRVKLEILGFIMLIIAITAALYFFGAERIVSYVGVENTYLVMFLIALFGGMTSIGGATYTTSIITFASGGSDPILIALMAGAGTAIGDSAYFLFSRHGSTSLKKSDNYFMKKINTFSSWIKKQKDVVVFLGIVAYTGFSPLPNDPLTISLGLSRVKKQVAIPALIIGDTTLAFILAYSGKVFLFI